MTTEARLFHSSNHHKWRPYQILGKEHPNLPTNNRDRAERAVREGVSE